eukprot:COSAG05_NODE_61_length_23137_cov_22.080693_11_plen_312_part_00
MTGGPTCISGSLVSAGMRAAQTRRKLCLCVAVVAAVVAWEIVYAIFAVVPATGGNRNNGERSTSLGHSINRGWQAATRLPVRWVAEPLLDLGSIVGLDCTAGEPSAWRQSCSASSGGGAGMLVPEMVAPHGGRNDVIPGRVAICGLSRNNRWTLPRMRTLIERLGAQFEQYKVMIVENDSNDGTQEYLRRWARQDPGRVTVLSENYHLQKRPSHQFLADLRNKYVDAVRQGGSSNVDYMLVLDMDLLDIDVAAFRRAVLESPVVVPGGSWTMLAANGVSRNGRYYDVFALRSEGVNAYDPVTHEIKFGVGE